MTRQKKHLKTVSLRKRMLINIEDDKKGQNISCQSPFKAVLIMEIKYSEKWQKPTRSANYLLCPPTCPHRHRSTYFH